MTPHYIDTVRMEIVDLDAIRLTKPGTSFDIIATFSPHHPSGNLYEPFETIYYGKESGYHSFVGLFINLENDSLKVIRQVGGNGGYMRWIYKGKRE